MQGGPEHGADPERRQNGYRNCHAALMLDMDISVETEYLHNGRGKTKRLFSHGKGPRVVMFAVGVTA